MAGNARRLIELGVAPPLAKEIVAQINSSTGNVRRLGELGMPLPASKLLAASVSSHSLGVAGMVQSGVPTVLVRELVSQVGGGTPTPTPTPSAEADAWESAIIAAGGTVSPTTKAAVVTMMNDIGTAGFRSKILRLNPFAGSNLAACLVPLIKDAGGAADTNTNFVSGDYTEATGLQGNGTTKHLATGLIPATHGLSASGVSLGAYIRNNRTASQNYPALGCYDGTNSLALHPLFANLMIFDSFGAAGGRETHAQTSSLGMFIGSRQSATDSRIYHNGVQQGATLATSQNAPPTTELEVFRNGASLGNRSADLLAGYFIGLGLTPSDVSNLYNITQAFQTALGRAV